MKSRNTPNLKFSAHANARMRQRGYTNHDIALVREYGTPVNDGYVMTRNDIRFAMAESRNGHQRLERLAGTALIEKGRTLVTVYRASRLRQRRLLARRA